MHRTKQKVCTTTACCLPKASGVRQGSTHAQAIPTPPTQPCVNNRPAQTGPTASIHHNCYVAAQTAMCSTSFNLAAAPSNCSQDQRHNTSQQQGQVTMCCASSNTTSPTRAPAVPACLPPRHTAQIQRNSVQEVVVEPLQSLCNQAR